MELSFNQKKEIGSIAVLGSCACFEFNTKINFAIKKQNIYKDEFRLKCLNEYITSFKVHFLEYIDILEYRVLELCYEMFSVDSIYNDMCNIDHIVNDDRYNFISLLLAYVEKILKLRNRIISVGVCRENCDRSLSTMISLLGVEKKYVR